MPSVYAEIVYPLSLFALTPIPLSLPDEPITLDHSKLSRSSNFNNNISLPDRFSGA